MNKDTKLPRVVILTALPIEYRAVRRHLTKLREETYNGTIYERGIFQAGTCQWEVGILQAGIGNAPTAAEAERAIAYFQPRVVLFVGIAGGLKDVRIGDVVAATKVYGYESGKAESDFLPRPEVGLPTHRMEQRARMEATKNGWLQRLGRQIPNFPPRAFVAPIAAGEKVLASTNSPFWIFLKKNYNNALAVEMEGYGFYSATHLNQEVDALIVRGISDLIDHKSQTDAANSQEIAARNASAFAFEVLANLCTEDQALASREKAQSKEGITLLERGRTTLMHGDYSSARQYLRKALGLLPEDRAPKHNAQTRFLLALTHLHGERPFSANIDLDVWERVEELLRTSIRLSPCYSYLYTFALFELDFSRHGWKKAQYKHEAQQLMHEANNLPQLELDKENLGLLSKSQCKLMLEMQDIEE